MQRIACRGFVYATMAPSFPSTRMASHDPQSAQHSRTEALANHLPRVPANNFHPRIFPCPKACEGRAYLGWDSFFLGGSERRFRPLRSQVFRLTMVRTRP